MTYDWQAKFFKIGATRSTSTQGIIVGSELWSMDDAIAREYIEEIITERHGPIERLTITYLEPREE